MIIIHTFHARAVYPAALYRLKFKALVFLLLWLFTGNQAEAQYFSVGQSPANVRWRIIKTDNFKIIFPKGFEESAMKMANIIEYARGLDTVSLRSKPSRIPIVLHHFNAISNGFVSWAPKRMELYLVPPQDNYAQDWYEQLAIHEYRHVLQVSKMNQGITGKLHYLFGEQISGAVLGLYVPMWFMEGDAVLAETLQSHSGRGRQPSFTMPLRAQILEKGIYSYDKAVFGSYKDFVPDHYVLGYHLVSMGRAMYGDHIWDSSLDKVARNPFIPNPFHRRLKTITGMGISAFSKTMLQEWKTIWQQEQEKLHPEHNGYPRARKPGIYTHYIKPQLTGEHTIIAEKKALNDIARFVEIDSLGNEKVLVTPGYYFPGSMNVSHDWIVWSELDFDPRWDQRNFSVIKAYNRKSGIYKQVSRKTRLYSPALSPDGTLLAAIEADDKLRFNLVIFSFPSGEIVHRFHLPDNHFLSQPGWSSDGQSIVLVLHGDNGKAIARINYPDGQVILLVDYTRDDIAWPVLFGDKLVFRAPWNGTDNLYLKEITSGKMYQITHSRYGVDNPSFSNDEKYLVYSEYTPDGFTPALLKLDDINLLPVDKTPGYRFEVIGSFDDSGHKVFQSEEIPELKNIKVEDYPQWKHLFNVHSWAPLVINPQSQEIRPGISLLSQNVLSSAFLNMGWEYLNHEKAGRMYARFSYHGWYPVFSVDVDYGRRKARYQDSTHTISYYSWNETNMNLGMNLPLNLTRGRFVRYVNGGIRFYYTQRDIDPESGLKFRQSNIKSIQYGFLAQNYLKMSGHDIHPRWGQMFSFRVRHTPFDTPRYGFLMAAEGRLFFPGIQLHHSLNFYSGFQKNSGNAFINPAFIRFPRGYSFISDPEILAFSVNYSMPLLYPDLNIPSLLYLKRLHTNVFFDIATGSENRQQYHYPSTGFEMYGDMHLFRFIAPITLGSRISYAWREKRVRPEFIFSVNFGAL